MFRSRFRLVALAVAACAFVGSALAAAVVQPVVAVWRFVTGHAREACALASLHAEAKQVKPTTLVKAGAFAAALAKRERPVMSPTWRMCPST